MKPTKVLFAGPSGVGKTTAIAAISDGEPICTNRWSSDSEGSERSATTVAMDFAMTTLPRRGPIHVYGAPGQPHLRAMWSILARGAHGLILLIDSTSPDPLGELSAFLRHFRDAVSLSNLVVGVTRLNTRRTNALQAYRDLLAEQGVPCPVEAVDPRRRAHVERLLELALRQPCTTREIAFEPARSEPVTTAPTPAERARSTFTRAQPTAAHPKIMGYRI